MNAAQKKKWDELYKKMDKLSETHDSIWMDWIDGYDALTDLWIGYMESLEGDKADSELEELEEFLKDYEDKDEGLEESAKKFGRLLKESRPLRMTLDVDEYMPSEDELEWVGQVDIARRPMMSRRNVAHVFRDKDGVEYLRSFNTWVAKKLPNGKVVLIEPRNSDAWTKSTQAHLADFAKSNEYLTGPKYRKEYLGYGTYSSNSDRIPSRRFFESRLRRGRMLREGLLSQEREDSSNKQKNEKAALERAAKVVEIMKALDKEHGYTFGVRNTKTEDAAEMLITGEAQIPFDQDDRKVLRALYNGLNKFCSTVRKHTFVLKKDCFYDEAKFKELIDFLS